MKDLEAIIILAKEAAKQGHRPHYVLRMIAARMEPTQEGRVSYIQIERCLLRAFDVPLREARDIERWKGISEVGDLTDEDIDTLFFTVD